MIQQALDFAALAHDGQKRKATQLPYIVHPVGVMLVLIECGETDEELLAAALLHDVVEDTSVTLEQVRFQFGERVAAIVEGCSEPDKGDTWENRKTHTIAQLKTASRDVAMVAAADKLHNIRSMITDHREMGDQLWTRFKRGPQATAWYYREVARSLCEGSLKDHAIVKKLGDCIQDLFDAVPKRRD